MDAVPRPQSAASPASPASPGEWGSDELCRVILDSAAGGIVAIDERGVLRAANRAALRLFGYEAPEPVGRDVSLLMPDLHLDRQMGLVSPGGSAAPSAAAPAFCCETEGRRRDGSRIALELAVSEAKLESGRLLVATLREAAASVTAQAAFCAEHEFVSAVLETTGAVVMVLDPSGRILRFNRAGQRLTGYSLEEVAGRRVWDVFAPPDEVEQVEKTFRSLASGDLPDERESHWVVRDGSRRLLAWSHAVIEDSDGSIRHFVCTGIDVTERGRAQEALRRREEQLRETQRLETIGLLASGIAHDFNNLVSVMLASSSALETHIAGDRAALAELDLIRQAAEQAIGVTGSLLTFSRDDPVDKRPVRLRSVVSAAAELLRRILPARVELIVELPPDGESWIDGDATQLQQVLLNLAINARDAMPGGGTLRIGLECSHGPGALGSRGDAPGFGRISVDDTGSGISHELQPRIFEPFFSTKAPGQGVGLGLSLAQRVVSEHGGRIEVRSQPGEGTTFVIELPCVDPPRSPPGDAPRPPARQTAGALVLLVESHGQIRAALAATLESLGCEVAQVAGDSELLECFAKHRHRLALLVVDVGPLAEDGLSRLSALRAAGATAPAIVLTDGASTACDGGRGALDVALHKPFEMSEFADAVAERLAASHGGASPP